MVLTLESKIQEKVYRISVLGKAAETGHMSGVSLHGGLERPLLETVKVKFGLS